MVALYWMAGRGNYYKQFVANRVKQFKAKIKLCGAMCAQAKTQQNWKVGGTIPMNYRNYG